MSQRGLIQMTAATILPLLIAVVALIALDIATSSTNTDTYLTTDDGSE